jgi:hypothetical protein
VVGIAYWPGAVPDVWGDENTGINPCNAALRANLVRPRRLARRDDRPACPRSS